jgi:4a-hydroxytetrahydrobiopterin dehydratase
MPRLLDVAERDRQLADLPAVATGVQGALTLAVRAPSFADAVRLVQRVAEDAETMDHHPDIDLHWRTVTFTLSTHSVGGVTQLDVELAHQILRAAADVGAETLPPPERVEIALDCLDAAALRPFWAAALGYREQVPLAGGTELQDPAGRGPVLWFQPMDVARPGPPEVRKRFHLDVYVADDAAPRRVQACLAAGGRLVTDVHAPSWWVLADPEGNEVCICTRAPDPQA